MGKIRLDALLVKNGQVQSRERAKALIMAGQVYVKNQKCDKAGQMVDEDTTVAEIRGETLKYVSRGGLKLEKAMQEFPITLEGKTTMDMARQQAGSPIVCSKTVLSRYSPLTLATVSSRGNYVRTKES